MKNQKKKDLEPIDEDTYRTNNYYLLNCLPIPDGYKEEQVHIKFRYRYALHLFKADINKKRWGIRAYLNLVTQEQMMNYMAAKGTLDIKLGKLQDNFQKAEEGTLDLKELYKNDPKVIHSFNPQRETFLYLAARGNQEKMVKTLILMRANPNVRQRSDSTPLHVAAYYGHAEIVKYLFHAGADPELTNTFHNGRRTAREEAALYRDDAAKLVEKVFDEYWDNKEGRLFSMAALGNLTYFRDLFKDYTNFDLQKTNFFGHSLLHLATLYEHTDLVKFLLDHKADINALDKSGSTPLHLACYKSYKTIVQLFIEQGAQIDIKNKYGFTPAQETSKNEIKDIFTDISHFKKVEEDKDCTWFPANWDKRWKYLRDSQDRTLLHLAVRFGNIKLVKFLVDMGIDINAQQKSGSTPLHTAVYRGRAEIVEFLLNNGAGGYIINGENYTPERELERLTPLDGEKMMNIAETKKRISALFNHHEISFIKTFAAVFRVNLYDDSNQLTHSLSIHPYTSFEYLINIILPNWDKKYYMRDTDQADFEVFPLYFSIAGRKITNSYSVAPVLQQFADSMNSDSQYIDFPISIQWCKNVEDKPTPKMWTTTRPRPRKAFKEIPLKAPLYITVGANENNDTVVNMDTFKLIFPAKLPKPLTLQITLLKNPLDGVITFKLCSACSIPWPRPEILFYEPDQISVLYIYDHQSMCWFGDPEEKNLRIPMAMGIFSLVHKKYITKTESLHYDLIDERYLKNDKNFIGILVNNFYYKIIPLKLYNEIPESWIKAYHGTTNSKGVLASIIRDGLLASGTISSNGVLINPPPGHFSPDCTFFNIPKFGRAIFLTPFFGYAFSNVFSSISQSNTEKYILECFVEPKCYTEFAPTVLQWGANLISPQWYTDDNKQEKVDIKLDPNNPEWRITDPLKVIVRAIIVIQDKPFS